MRGLYDFFCLFPGIYLHMVFFYLDLCRGKTVPAVYLIGQLLPAPLTEPLFQLLFLYGMFDHNDWQPLQVFFPFPSLLFWSLPGILFLTIIWTFRRDRLRFIKKNDLPFYFHKSDLPFGLMLLR